MVEQAAAPAEAKDERPLVDRIVDELSDERYALRSYNHLTSKFSVSRDAIDALLVGAGIKFVNRTRASDGALLIGLYDRN